MKTKIALTTFCLLLLGIFMWVSRFDTAAQGDPNQEFADLFSEEVTVMEVPCTLANGTESTCYQIDTISIPVFEIGPFCPETLDDLGGIWEWDGENPGLYLLNSDFFLMLEAQGYEFFDDEGNINIIGDVDPPAPGEVDDTHSCIMQTPDETITMTALIPMNPIEAENPTDLGTVAKVGIGIDGVPIFADAPSFFATGNIPALDVCGGHVDPGGWYHWHATSSDIDSSFDHEGLEDVHCHLEQSVSSLFGYAFDGYPIYGSAETNGEPAEDLDECNGHFGPTSQNLEGEYHYHATLDFPNLPPCLMGVVANNNFVTTASAGIGANQADGVGPGGNGPPNGNQAGGPGQNPINFAAAAEQLGVTEQQLRDALGTPPPDFEAAAEQLGITVEELHDALGITEEQMPPDNSENGLNDTGSEPAGQTADGLDTSLFFDGALEEEISIQDCTLSDGTETTCYEITIAGYPSNYDIGPFCPETIFDTAEDGGIWFDGNGVYDLDGPFIVGLAELYGDDNWLLYDDDGNVNITDTLEAFEAAARPDVDPAYQNYCVEGRIEWLENGEPVPTTVLIPTTPVAATSATQSRGNLGITLNGVIIANSAPVDAILGAYTIAAFDDCGGHINPFEGYHLHGAVGCSEAGEAVDGETPIFAYALDGYAIHSPLAEADEAAAELDGCNGHYTEADGYHYHANSAEENAVISCFMGLTVQGSGQGDVNGDRPPQDGNDDARPQGQGQGELNLAAAAEQLGVTEQQLRDALGTERPPDLEAAAEGLGVTVEELEQALGARQ